MKREVLNAAKVVGNRVLTQGKRPLGERRFRQVISESCGPLRVVIGGGHDQLPGWINTDLHWRAECYLDLTKRWPLIEGKCPSHVFGDNVIERFTLPTGRLVLRNIYEALLQGGVLRLATPDIGRLANAYVSNSSLVAPHLKMSTLKGLVAEYPVDLLRVTFAEFGHHLGYCYDFHALSTELERAGFSKVVRVEAGESSDPVLRGLERRISAAEAASSLVVEAYKE